MALNSTVAWMIRAGGNALNGGGYDAAVSGAGTDYSDQDACQLGPTADLTSTNSTTVTSALSTFTSAMVGNVLRLASGAGATTGYYMITGYTSATQITLDRVSGTYTAGVARIGGAHPTANQYANGGSATQPTLTTPLAAGHTVYVRGTAVDDPTTADYTMSGYLSFPDGNMTTGPIRWIGLPATGRAASGGRPRYDGNGLAWYSVVMHRFENFKFVAQGSSNGANGFVKGLAAFFNVYLDQNGYDITGFSGLCYIGASKIVNTGATQTSTTSPALQPTTNNVAFVMEGTVVNGWRGFAVDLDQANIASIQGNIIANGKSSSVAAIKCTAGANGDRFQVIKNNTIYNNASDGVSVSNTPGTWNFELTNNIIVKNGGYGLNLIAGTTAANDARKLFIDYNNYGTGGLANTSGNVHNISLGSHDVALDPGFTNAGSNDFSVGTAMKAIGFPSALPF